MDKYIYGYAAIIIGILLIIFLVPLSMPDDSNVFMSLWNKVELRRYEVVTDSARIMYGTFAKNINDDSEFILFTDQEELEKFIDDPYEDRDTGKIAGRFTGTLLHETAESFGIYFHAVIEGKSREVRIIAQSRGKKISAKMFIGGLPAEYFILSPINAM